MITYINAISSGFPAVQCHAIGDGSDYATIVWESGAPLPSQAVLDEWIAANPVAGHMKITCLAFRNRFTQTEKVILEIASLDDPTAIMTARQQAAMLRVYMRDVDNASYIDLLREDTRGGVQMLEAAGLLAPGRSAIILDTHPTDLELYKG